MEQEPNFDGYGTGYYVPTKWLTVTPNRSWSKTWDTGLRAIITKRRTTYEWVYQTKLIDKWDRWMVTWDKPTLQQAKNHVDFYVDKCCVPRPSNDITWDAHFRVVPQRKRKLKKRDSSWDELL